MSLLYAESGLNGSSDMRVVPSSFSSGQTDPWSGSSAFRMWFQSQNGPQYLHKPTAGTRIGGGGYYRFVTTTGQAVIPVHIFGQFSIGYGGLYVNSAGFLEARAMNVTNNAGTLRGSSAQFMRDGLWHWIEYDFDFQGSTNGIARVWVDNVLRINFSGGSMYDSGPTTAFDLSWNRWSNNDGDELFIASSMAWDTAGSICTPTMQPFGQLRVDQLLVTADSGTPGWTPSTGANWSTVDESGTYSSADYNSTSGGAGTRDLFVMSDMTITPNNILGVIAKANVQNNGGGVPTVSTIVKSGGVDGIGTAFTPTASYQAFRHCFDVDPNTSAAWTQSAVNAMTAGYEVQS